jgi:flagellum-specific ATP synthase
MAQLALDFLKYEQRLNGLRTMASTGRVSEVAGLVIESIGPAALIGEVCEVHTGLGPPTKTEVIGFRDNRVLLMPIGSLEGISMGNRVVATGHSLIISVGPGLLGRVLGGTGDPIDGKGPLRPMTGVRTVYSQAPDPLRRARVTKPLGSGIRAIDAFATLGKGQRMGIFSGSGVGKSTLMGEIAKHSEADVAVIGLIGERGREVREFIEDCLGPEGMARSVVVAVTSDQPALVRLKGALVATTIAEYFRDQGKDVMLMMDSVTRYCNAQREVGLSIGEPPTTRGYPPSTFALLPKLLERSGNSEKGSITGLYTVLVDGDDLQEPISDACRSILDGHIVLSRRLADRNHYPAIDILASISRTMKDVIPQEHYDAAKRLVSLCAVYRESEDLITIGAYNRGSDPRVDEAIEMMDPTTQYLQQRIGESQTFAEHARLLLELAGKATSAGATLKPVRRGAVPEVPAAPARPHQAVPAPSPRVPAKPVSTASPERKVRLPAAPGPEGARPASPAGAARAPGPAPRAPLPGRPAARAPAPPPAAPR